MASVLPLGVTQPNPVRGNAPRAEVRQLVTFRFAPGRTSEAIVAFRDRAVPLYEDNEAMLRFRGYREVESPIPLDLIVVSSFDGMVGMDRSNQRLRALAADAGASIGEIYGQIGALSIGHDDQFVTMLDAHESPQDTDGYLLLESIELVNEDDDDFQKQLVAEWIPWERERAILNASEAGRVLLGSGWHYIRFLGLSGLAALEEHTLALRGQAFYRRLAPGIRRVQRIVVASVPELAVR